MTIANSVTGLKIVFVVATMKRGGIETFVLRIAGQLKLEGAEVQVWILSATFDSDLLSAIGAVASVRILGPSLPMGAAFFPTAPEPLNKFDLIFATGRTTLLFVAKNNRRGESLPVVTGVYHQHEYVPSRNVHRETVAAQLFAALPPENVLFCTDGCRKDHSIHFGHQFLDSEVMPLYLAPARVDSSLRIRKNPHALNLLSIGRLAEFKTYNLYALDAIAALKTKGLIVEWTVIGDGILLPKMIAKAEYLGITGQVKFLGGMPYDALGGYYEKCDVYLGAGTTLLEAANCGCITVCSIDGEQSWNTSGFLHDREGDVHSDLVDSDIKTPLPVVLENVFQADDDVRKKWSDAAKQKVSGYSLANVAGAFLRLKLRVKFVALTLPRWFVTLDLSSIVSMMLAAVARGNSVRVDKVQ